MVVAVVFVVSVEKERKFLFLAISIKRGFGRKQLCSRKSLGRENEKALCISWHKKTPLV